LDSSHQKYCFWIKQFVKRFKEFMMDIKSINIETITSEIKGELEEAELYKYYNQAMEL
jgi:hypothetical protein